MKKTSMLRKIFYGGLLIFFGLPAVLILAFALFGPKESQEEAQKRVAFERQTIQRVDAEKQAKKAEADKKHAQRRMLMELCHQAQEAVKEQLRAPSTAQFPGCVMGMDQYEIRANEDGTKYSVKGVVDAQNGFGAMLRYRFVVLFDKQPDGSFLTRAAVGE